MSRRVYTFSDGEKVQGIAFKVNDVHPSEDMPRTAPIESTFDVDFHPEGVSSSSASSTNKKDHQQSRLLREMLQQRGGLSGQGKSSSLRVIDSGAFEPKTSRIFSSGPAIGHPFVRGVVEAFANHRPLILKPSHFWLLITQAVSEHVNEHSEQLRSNIVDFEGKRKLLVRRDSFVLGQPNDWADVVTEFGRQIDANVKKDVATFLSPQFSTDSGADVIASKLTSMSLLQKFFSYEVCTSCGFPEITLLGAVQDWQKLLDATRTLIPTVTTKEFGEKWLLQLETVLSRFVLTAQEIEDVASGKTPTRTSCSSGSGISGFFKKLFSSSSQSKASPANTLSSSSSPSDHYISDVDFWQSMAKRGGVGGSGGWGWINGWITVFFPHQPNGGKGYDPKAPYVVKEKGQEKWYDGPHQISRGKPNTPPPGVEGIGVEKFPKGLCEAPVVWDFLGNEMDLTFNAGFVAVGAEDLQLSEDDAKVAAMGGSDDPSHLAVYPRVGWYIQRKEEGEDSNKA